LSVTITVDAERRRIHSRIAGTVTLATLQDYYRELYAHSQFEPTMCELFDLSGVTEIALTAAEVRDFSHSTAVNTCKGKGVRVAILAPSDLAFGLARLYELTQVNSSNTLNVVRTLAAAEDWLASAPAEH